MPNCGPTAGFMEQILWVRMRWGGRVMVSSPATGYPFFPLWLWKSCDSAWWPREDIKMAVWDMLMLVSQLSFWKHKSAVAQAFNDTSVQPNCFSGLMLQRREWDQTGSSVWQGALRRSGGPWTNDPAKCITSSCYHPAPFPPSRSWFMMNFADLLAVNQKRKSSSISPFAPFPPPFPMISVLHMFNLMFKMFYCLQYIFKPHYIETLPNAPPCS